MPMLEIRLWPDAGDPAEIDYVLAWNHPDGFLMRFSNLRAIYSMGAGVDRLLKDPGLPEGVPIVRMVDPSLVAGMNEFVLMRVLHYHRRMPEYEVQQRAGLWGPLRPPLAEDRKVGIMGLGQLGRTCAASLAGLGFAVRGWSRTPKSLSGVQCFAGIAQLPAFLGETEILICLLPLTPETEGILNATHFAQLPQGAFLVNVARGAHLVEEDLIFALETGRIAHATLDVFRAEPLAADHPFWTHPRVAIIPHAAALTQPRTAARTVAANIARDRAGEPLQDVVDRQTGY
jgi:glyoxylate/hydroxypyruvate reductase